MQPVKSGRIRDRFKSFQGATPSGKSEKGEKTVSWAALAGWRRGRTQPGNTRNYWAWLRNICRPVPRFAAGGRGPRCGGANRRSGPGGFDADKELPKAVNRNRHVLADFFWAFERPGHVFIDDSQPRFHVWAAVGMRVCAELTPTRAPLGPTGAHCVAISVSINGYTADCIRGPARTPAQNASGTLGFSGRSIPTSR